MLKRCCLPAPVVKKTKLICEKFTKICLHTNLSGQNMLSVFDELMELMRKVMLIQKKWCLLRKLDKSDQQRTTCIQDLLCSGLCDETIQLRPISSEKYGFGLMVLSDVQKNDVILRVPRMSMLSAAGSTTFLNFISRDSIASKMENIALSLRLLCELAVLGQSPHYFYLRSLPSSYSNPLYMTTDDLLLLRGSPHLEVAVNNVMSICRQYAYFFNTFVLADRCSELPFGANFCFEDYRWAVSTVMSRSNLIPAGGKCSGQKLHLVPIWDMFNHKSGWVSTDYDPDADELVFYAMEDVSAGDEVFMDYGKRTNAEFFLFSGFLPQCNPHNRLKVTLSVSKSDRLASKRMTLLNSIGLKNPTSAQLSGDYDSLVDLLAFARVFVMSQGQLDDQLSHFEVDSYSVVDALRATDADCDLQLNRIAIDFLIKRFELLIRAYGTLISEDEASQLTQLKRNCLHLVRQEIAILRSSIIALKSVLDASTSGLPSDVNSLRITD